MGSAFSSVVLCEALPQPVRLNANDGVGLLIEIRTAMEYVNAYRIFFYLVTLPGERLFAEISE